MQRFFFSFNGKLTLLYVSDSHLTRVNFVSPGILSKIWRYFGLSQLGRNEGATGTQWAETREDDKHPTMTQDSPPKQNSLAINVNSAEVENCWGVLTLNR